MGVQSSLLQRLQVTYVRPAQKVALSSFSLALEQDCTATFDPHPWFPDLGPDYQADFAYGNR